MLQVLDAFLNQRKTHIFWGLVKVFRTIAHFLVRSAQTDSFLGFELVVQSLMMLVQAFAYIANPIGITGVLKYVLIFYGHHSLFDSLAILLGYLEKRGEDATVRPWVWVAWLFLGPTIASIASQLSDYFSVRSSRFPPPMAFSYL